MAAALAWTALAVLWGVYLLALFFRSARPAPEGDGAPEDPPLSARERARRRLRNKRRRLRRIIAELRRWDVDHGRRRKH